MFVHALREQDWEAARGRLEGFVALFLQKGAAASCEVHAGQASGVIRDCAARYQADLLVLGRGACHPGARLSCANVMQKLMDEGACDILVGPQRQGDGSGLLLAA